MENAWLFETPNEIALSIAANEKKLRKSKGITQRQLSEMTGIPLPTIRLFEQRGTISFVSLVKISLSLGTVEEMKSLFSSLSFRNIDEVIKYAKKNR